MPIRSFAEACPTDDELLLALRKLDELANALEDKDGLGSIKRFRDRDRGPWIVRGVVYNRKTTCE